MPTTLAPITFIAGILIAAAGGLLGGFALLRRMALVGDALSHVALPGIALALLFHVNIFWGAFAFLLLGTLLIWAVEHKTKLPVDTLVGVFFALALAVGALLSSGEELLDALFGDITQITGVEALAASAIAVIIIAVLTLYARRFTLALISPDLALSVGMPPHRLELLFLLIFALTVAVGIKFTGALLMGSLVVIPAAAARNIARSMRGYLAISALLGAIGAAAGLLGARLYGFPPGPTFVLVAGFIFFVSIFFKR